MVFNGLYFNELVSVVVMVIKNVGLLVIGYDYFCDVIV